MLTCFWSDEEDKNKKKSKNNQIIEEIEENYKSYQKIQENMKEIQLSYSKEKNLSPEQHSEYTNRIQKYKLLSNNFFDIFNKHKNTMQDLGLEVNMQMKSPEDKFSIKVK